MLINVLVYPFAVDYITYTLLDDIAVLSIDTKTRYNLVNMKFMHEFIDVLDMFSREPKVRFLAIRGEKDNLGSGADINELKNASAQREYAQAFFGLMKEMFNRLMNYNKVLIGYVNGVAYGASMELLLVMDYVIATSSAKFAAPGARLGVFPPVLVTVGPDRIGWEWTRRLAFEGQEIDANTALTIGLVNEINDGPFQAAVQNAARKFRQMAPSSLTSMRRVLYLRYKDLLAQAFNALIDQVLTMEAQEGIYSWFAKAKPSWATP